MRIIYRKSFIKSYAGLPKTAKEKVDSAIMLFEEEPFNVKLKNHALSGRLQGLRSISAAFDLRIVFEEQKGYVVVSMIHVGTHNQVY